MDLSIGTLLFALASFIATFAVARALRQWFLKRKGRKDEQQAARNQSRQVRRAQQRRKGGR
jgi:hypothetical protein